MPSSGPEEVATLWERQNQDVVRVTTVTLDAGAREGLQPRRSRRDNELHDQRRFNKQFPFERTESLSREWSVAHHLSTRTSLSRLAFSCRTRLIASCAYAVHPTALSARAT